MPLLDCRGLTRRFGALVAVERVDLTVEPGEIRALIGPNGAGKSTVFNLITSTLKPNAGEVRFAGEAITGLPVHRVAQRGIARTFQRCHVYPSLSVRENVRLAAQAREAGRWHFVGGRRVLADSRAAADEALERLRLSRHAEAPADTLSHGDQRLLEVAMALAQRPRLLMLDEPTQGLSVEETDHAVGILTAMLAAGELRAFAAPALGERRKHFEQALDRPALRRRALRDLDVLDHRQVGKDHAPFGHVAHA